MGFYFDEDVSTKELLDNCGDDHTCDSVAQEAEMMLHRRGVTQEQISEYTSYHDLDD